MATTFTLAEELFEKIKNQTNPAEFLKGMTDQSVSPTFESDYLDFKAKPDPDKKNSEVKKIWYEALSGFGNSGGGVLIWGIDARKGPGTDIDAACDVKPIQNPNAFKSLLVELQRGATDPPLGNVKIEAWELNSGEGFVVCLIPSGPFKPYRAEVSGKKQFHLRAVDTFFVPSVAILRSLFYPQSRAIFKVNAVLSFTIDRISTAGQRFVNCRVDVENVGTGTAIAPHIVMKIGPEPGPSKTARISEWRIMTRDNRTWTCDGDRPIHPNAAKTVVIFSWIMRSVLSPPIRLGFTFYAENQPQQATEIEFPPENYEITAVISKSAVAIDSQIV